MRPCSRARLANGFKRGFLNANLFISKILQRPVCSFYSDDDSLDFACVSDNGVLQRVRCQCGDLEIVYQNGRVTIQPLQLEIDEDEGDLTHFSHLHDPEAVLPSWSATRNSRLSCISSLARNWPLFSTYQPLRSVWEALTSSRKCRSKSHQAIRPLIHSNPPARPWWKLAHAVCLFCRPPPCRRRSVLADPRYLNRSAIEPAPN
jgi:hypothetical protein